MGSSAKTEEGYEDKGVGRKGGPPVTAAGNFGCKWYIAKGQNGDEFARFVRKGAELSMEIGKRYGDKGPQVRRGEKSAKG